MNHAPSRQAGASLCNTFGDLPCSYVYTSDELGCQCQSSREISKYFLSTKSDNSDNKIRPTFCDRLLFWPTIRTRLQKFANVCGGDQHFQSRQIYGSGVTQPSGNSNSAKPSPGSGG